MLATSLLFATACSDDAAVSSGPTTTTSTLVVASTGTVLPPPSTAVATTTAPPSTFPPSTTTTRRVAGRLVDTRRPEPAGAKTFVRDGEHFERAIALPDGSLLIATRAPLFDRCSALIHRVDPATGARTTFAQGAAPAISPDGTKVVYAALRSVGGDCSIDRTTVRDLTTGADHVLAVHVADVASIVSVGFTWSPDGAYLHWYTAYDLSDGGGRQLFDVRNDRPVTFGIAPTFGAQLTEKTHVADPPYGNPDPTWELHPFVWLDDGTLAAGLSAGYGQAFDQTVPLWYRVPFDGVLRSFDEAITDPTLVRALDACARSTAPPPCAAP